MRMPPGDRRNDVELKSAAADGDEFVNGGDDLLVEPGWAAHLLEQEAVLGMVAVVSVLGLVITLIFGHEDTE